MGPHSWESSHIPGPWLCLDSGALIQKPQLLSRPGPPDPGVFSELVQAIHRLLCPPLGTVWDWKCLFSA